MKRREILLTMAESAGKGPPTFRSTMITTKGKGASEGQSWIVIPSCLTGELWSSTDTDIQPMGSAETSEMKSNSFWPSHSSGSSLARSRPSSTTSDIRTSSSTGSESMIPGPWVVPLEAICPGPMEVAPKPLGGPGGGPEVPDRLW
ncbi:hypothetical protein JZ751_018713 [Albula glossodonta]|uniref:Uncharacterized protein n=1 Tax=Albula glossodonta TaxID=121402 RepID=A0A8T2NR50_9TELE|nr:hypothetical protein JZ751_018713 [Albula glossodonta]